MNLLTAADVMTPNVLVLTPSLPIYDAIESLVRHRLSGAPVVSEATGPDDHVLVGILSERDCLRTLANGALYGLPGGTVGDFMTADVRAVRPNVDVLALASLFLDNPWRRLPVIDGRGHLLGIVSRHDILRGTLRMRDPDLRYPDHQRPGETADQAERRRRAR
ncbi:MAG: CBS domain-containing protein [Alphaproteobacteria bacterium]|nr:CBS domain-containing protein [Alphaproteobacteria bacterium]